MNDFFYRKLKNISVSSKIQMIIIGLLFAFLVLMAIFLMNAVATNYRDMEKRMQNAEKNVEGAFRFYKKHLITLGKILAENPKITGNIRGNSDKQAVTISKILADFQKESLIQYTWAYNASGTVFAMGHDRFAGSGYNDGKNPLFRNSFYKGDAVYSITPLNEEKFLLKVAVPIKKGAAVMGVCVLGIRLDAMFATTIREISGIETFILNKTRLLGASFGIPDRASRPILLSPADKYVRINGILYNLHFTHIWKNPNLPGLRIAVAVDNSTLRAGFQKNSIFLLSVFLFLVAVSYYFSGLVGSQISDSLKIITNEATRIGRQDFSGIIDLKSKDELGLLARTLNSMSEKIKNYANSLMESETRFRQITELSPFPIMVIDRENTVEYLNPLFINIFGYTPKDIRSEQQWMEKAYPSPDYRQEVTKQWEMDSHSIASHTEIMVRTSQISSKNGTIKYVVSRMVALGNGKRLIVLEDITARMMAERALRASERNLLITLNSIGDGVIVTDPGENIVRMNPMAEQLTGWSMRQALGRPLHEIFNLTDSRSGEAVENPVRKTLRTGRAVSLYNHATLISKTDGQKYQIEDSAAPIREDDGKLVGIVMVFRNITERYKAREELRESNERYHELFSRMLSGFAVQEVIYDTNGEPVDYRFLEVNPAFEKITGMPENQVAGKTLRELFPGVNEQWLNTCGEVAKTQKPKHLVYYSKTFHKYLEAFIYTSRRGMLAFLFNDVSERKEAEKQIQESLKEKDILLKEIHHRVKNNFQIISGLLFLQSQNVADSESEKVLEESQNRIHSMALIHKKLYQTGDLAKINFSEYANGLVEDLFNSYGVTQESVIPDITVNPQVSLNIDSAIPCGLIINELVTNALKYAFPGGKGNIYLTSYIQGDRTYLIIADNGVGLPSEEELSKKETLGLSLVETLVGQLHGSMEINRKEGTEFQISFPKNFPA
jgi:PAS domain S-box-containing protein